MQKANAGRKAEKVVRQIIDAMAGEKSTNRAMHGGLFVFKAGTSQEYSAEADHILVTRHHLYLIETKYKSSTIVVDALASTWQTITPYGEGIMPNALLQVKNTAKVLNRELDLGIDMLPMVAIVGKHTLVTGAPSNVVAASDLRQVIEAFEQAADKKSALDPHAVIARIRSCCTEDPDAFVRHVERIQAKRMRQAHREIIDRASLE